MMAALRAHHFLTESPPRILDDSLAKGLIGAASEAEVGAWVERFVELLTPFGGRDAAERAVHRLTMYACARSRFVEDQLAASLSRGMKQVVILGAGLDSMAYRSPDLVGSLRLFEVDYPATQAWKREKLASLPIALPDNLTFVPCDFERQTLTEALSAGGVRTEMSLFSWLGVQPYLADEVVMSTLDLVASFPTGSELVLDLVTSGDGRPRDPVLEGSRQLLHSIGEPFKSAYAPERFEARLRERGFDQIAMLSYPDWYRCQKERFDGRYSMPEGRSILVSAQVG
jgi:methyltransferase (TIGR00027 family)